MANIIALLNGALASERQAIIQYDAHAAAMAVARYAGAAGSARAWRDGEQHHAEELSERIRFLGGEVSADVLPANIAPPSSLVAMIRASLVGEEEAIGIYAALAKAALEDGDMGTHALALHLLVEEEGHARYLRAQLTQVEQMGLSNWLSLQVGG